MYNLDLKDRKILYQLDLNCRQSNAQIGKKVGLSRKVVDYRIKKMEDEGIITNYQTAINTFKLGYNVFRIYINFQDITLDIKKEIIQYFVNYKYSWAVLTSQGPIELDAVLWVNNFYEFYRFWTETLDKYEKYFAQKIISIYIEGIDYKKSYLLNEKLERLNREKHKERCGDEIVKIEKLDYKILNEIALNARTSLIKLADKLKCSSQGIKYRIDILIKKGIIQGFHLNINYLKLNLHHVIIDFYLKEFKNRNLIIEYLQENPNFISLSIGIGGCDLGLEFIVENIEHMNLILEKLENKFPNMIKKYVYWIMVNVHKERWLPEMEFK